MRTLSALVLLLSLVSSSAFAERLYQVEILLFRQAGSPLISPKVAPDDWAGTALPVSGNARPIMLKDEAEKLRGNGYQVLLHHSWMQPTGERPQRSAVTVGDDQFGHYPVQGTLTFAGDSPVSLSAEFWINQFDNGGIVTASEHFKAKRKLKNNVLTYLDQGSLGALVRIRAQ